MKFIKFLGVGGVATAIQYLLLMLMVEMYSQNAVQASVIAYLVSSIFNYLLNYYFTFSSAADHFVALSRFSVVVIIGLGVNGAIMYLLVERYEIYYLFSQIGATIIVLFWNFLAHQYWTYNHG